MSDRDPSHRVTTLPRPTWWSLALVFGLALGWRLAILLRTGFAIDGDEGTIGLMALHISRAAQFPVFFYGQPYMGALESYVAALPMAVFGAGAVALKLTGLAFALVTVGLGWALARRVLGAAGGLATALYLALPAAIPSVWSLKLRGGYTSLLALGFGILLLAWHVGTRGATRRNSLALGLMVGVATWLHLLAFPIVGAAGLFLAARRQLVNRVDTLVSAGCGFLLGAAPLLLANLFSGGETFRFLASRGRLGEQLGVPLDTFTWHLGMLLGTAPMPGSGLASPPWAAGLAALFAVGLVLFLWRERGSLAGFLRFGGRSTSGAELFVLVAALFLPCVAFTRFGAEQSPRFALVLLFLIAPVIGSLVAFGWEGRGARARGLTALAFAALLALNAHSLWREFDNPPGPYTGSDYDPYVRGSGPASTLALLQAQGVDGLASDHFVRHSINFLSGDTIVPSPGRHAGHARRFRDAERIAWATEPGNRDARVLLPVLDHLADAGVVADAYEVDGQRIAVLRHSGHRAAGWSAQASGAEQRVAYAIDRDPRTAWRAAVEADGAVPRLELDLGQTLTLARLGFIFMVARPKDGTLRPQYLVLRTSLDGESWSPPLRLAPAADLWSVEIPPVAARHLRLESIGPQAISWELSELLLYER